MLDLITDYQTWANLAYAGSVCCAMYLLITNMKEGF